jgi:type I restriction-modification system DNA methylase subunit
MWNEIKRRTDEHGYMSGVDRMTDRVKETGEVFTPTDLVIEIVQKQGVSTLAPGKTVLDPACGDGQFLVVAKWVKVLHHGMTEQDALDDIYGVDIMRDNIDLCKARLGGGHIVMGDTLNSNIHLPEQTAEEYHLMKEWFGEPDLTHLFG